jgi:DNA-binding PadR family transcriptional regulator
MHGYHEEEHSRGRCRHRHFGGRGFFGRFGVGSRTGSAIRAAKMLASGDLQLIILLLLAEKPRHGYDIIKALEEHSSGIYAPSPGMVYPALTYLDEMGYTTSETEGTKKLYRITDAGTEYLTKNRSNAEEMLDQLARFGKKMAQFREQYADEHDEGGESEGDIRGGTKSEWHQARGEFRRLRQELKAALYEKIGASTEERQRVIAILRRAVDEIRGK